jgi:8-oxo-dGTP diphosphatase
MSDGSSVEFTNMVMVTDPKTGLIAVIERVRSWCGLAFPGGHVERGESFYDSAVREVYEETGLTVRRLESCGIIHWIHADTGARYIVMCYKTDDFSGSLKSRCDEGRLRWMSREELESTPSDNDFKKYLPLFFGSCCEAVGLHNDCENLNFRYI